MLRRRGDLDATYEIFGLDPGGYFLGLQDELGDVLEPLTSVDVTDRMVRVDLSARCREDSSLRVNLIGLSKDDVASVGFVWIDGAAPNGGWSALRRDAVDATSFRVRPAGGATPCGGCSPANPIRGRSARPRRCAPRSSRRSRSQTASARSPSRSDPTRTSSSASSSAPTARRAGASTSSP
jgi:hypothetical protein